MAKIISKIDIELKIPPYFKGLTGRDWLTIEFKKGEPKEVSEKVAEYYTRSQPKKFKYAEQEDFEFYKPEEITEPPAEFDANEFFEKNVENIEEAINAITERKPLFAICKFMGLTNYVTQSKERLKERIISDIKIHKEQQEKLGTNS